jgi:hypothetical protein
MKRIHIIVLICAVPFCTGIRARDFSRKQHSSSRNDIIVKDIVLSNEQVGELEKIYGSRPQQGYVIVPGYGPVGYGF